MVDSYFLAAESGEGLGGGDMEGHGILEPSFLGG